MHFEDMLEEAHALREKISSGKAFLEVVAYPWGVEFDLRDGADSS
jgi:hypothetical protein